MDFGLFPKRNFAHYFFRFFYLKAAFSHVFQHFSYVLFRCSSKDLEDRNAVAQRPSGTRVLTNRVKMWIKHRQFTVLLFGRPSQYTEVYPHMFVFQSCLIVLVSPLKTNVFRSWFTMERCQEAKV